MGGLLEDRKSFLAKKARYTSACLQMAAVRLACGIDLEALLRARPEERRKAVTRLERFIERERLKGLSRHWSYDLNRHIALVQALETLGRTDEIVLAQG